MRSRFWRLSTSERTFRSARRSRSRCASSDARGEDSSMAFMLPPSALALASEAVHPKRAEDRHALAAVVRGAHARPALLAPARDVRVALRFDRHLPHHGDVRAEAIPAFRVLEPDGAAAHHV